MAMCGLAWLVGRARKSVSFLQRGDSSEGEERGEAMITSMERKPNGLERGEVFSGWCECEIGGESLMSRKYF